MGSISPNDDSSKKQEEKNQNPCYNECPCDNSPQLYKKCTSDSQEKEIKQETQIEWIPDIYFHHNGHPNMDGSSFSDAHMTKNVLQDKNNSPQTTQTSVPVPETDINLPNPPNNMQSFDNQSPLKVRVFSYEESGRRCDVLFRMADIYRNLWQHENMLRDQRTGRFWLINAGLFCTVWVIISQQSWGDVGFPHTITVQVRNILDSWGMGESFVPSLALRNFLISLIGVFGAFNSLVFLYQLVLGEKAYSLLNVRYKGFLSGVFQKSTISNSSEIACYIKNHNLSGISLVPPIFGLHANTQSNQNQSTTLLFTDNSFLKLWKKDGYLGQDLFKTLFLARGMCFFYIWLCVAAFCFACMISNIFPLDKFNYILPAFSFFLLVYFSVRYIRNKSKKFRQRIKEISERLSKDKKYFKIKLCPLNITIQGCWGALKEYRIRNGVRVFTIFVGFLWFIYPWFIPLLYSFFHLILDSHIIRSYNSLLSLCSIFLYSYTILLFCVFKPFIKVFGLNYIIHLFYYTTGEPTKILVRYVEKIIKKEENRIEKEELKFKEKENRIKKEELEIIQEELKFKKKELEIVQKEAEIMQVETEIMQVEAESVRGEVDRKKEQLKRKKEELEGKKKEVESQKTNPESEKAEVESQKPNPESEKSEIESQKPNPESKKRRNKRKNRKRRK